MLDYFPILQNFLLFFGWRVEMIAKNCFVLQPTVLAVRILKKALLFSKVLETLKNFNHLMFYHLSHTSAFRNFWKTPVTMHLSQKLLSLHITLLPTFFLLSIVLAITYWFYNFSKCHIFHKEISYLPSIFAVFLQTRPEKTTTPHFQTLFNKKSSTYNSAIFPKQHTSLSQHHQQSTNDIELATLHPTDHCYRTSSFFSTILPSTPYHHQFLGRLSFDTALLIRCTGSVLNSRSVQ